MPNVVIYELNEVPWAVVDWYVGRKPAGALAKMLRVGACLTTLVPGDPNQELQPWRTWPTLHTSTSPEDHNSWELGQDPATFRGVPLWDVLDSEGFPVGLFGAMQTWPAKRFHSGGFYVPDTFARDAATFPERLEPFQAFNLAMTEDNLFSAGSAITPSTAIKTALRLFRLGLSARSTLDLASQLVGERREHRLKGRRSALQVLPSFDLFRRLCRQESPKLSIFFTNHVAGMMHRYWGDAMPGYAAEYGYEPDQVFAGFLEYSMDLADRQLAILLKQVEAGNAYLVLASGMGQAALTPGQEGPRFVLEDLGLLAAELGLGRSQAGLAMYPHYSLTFEDERATEQAHSCLESLHSEQFGPMFGAFVRRGRSVSFGINTDAAVYGEDVSLNGCRPGGASVATSPRRIGIRAQHRLGGANTGGHIAEGILIACGQGLTADASRRPISLLDVAPSVLNDLLGIDPDPAMKGRTGALRAGPAGSEVLVHPSADST